MRKITKGVYCNIVEITQKSGSKRTYRFYIPLEIEGEEFDNLVNRLERQVNII